MWSGSGSTSSSSIDSLSSFSIDSLGYGDGDEFTKDKRIIQMFCKNWYVISIKRRPMNELVTLDTSILHVNGNDEADEVVGDWGEGLDDGNDDDDGNILLDIDG